MSARLVAALFAALALLAPACATKGQTETTVGDAVGPQTVGLTVREGPGGATLAFAPVIIDGKGPFPFAIDTGAANSVIATELASELQLDVVEDSQHTVRGVGGQTKTELVQVENWRIGESERKGITLPASDLSTVELPGQLGDAGLLGSDVLSTFGTVTVDYDNATLRLGDSDGND